MVFKFRMAYHHSVMKTCYILVVVRLKRLKKKKKTSITQALSAVCERRKSGVKKKNPSYIPRIKIFGKKNCREREADRLNG